MVYAAICAPQLVVIALFGAIAFVVPRIVVGTLFVLCQEDMSVPALYVVAHVLAEEVVRYKVLQWLMAAEAFFQAKGQVLHPRLSLLGLAVGGGFGLTQLLTGPGSLAAYASQFVSGIDDVPFDPSVCPQMSLLMHTGLQSIMMYACQWSWSVTMILCIGASPAAASDSGGSAVDVHPVPPSGESAREMQTAPRLEESHGKPAHTETAPILSSSVSRKKRERAPRAQVPTIARAQAAEASWRLCAIASVVALHVLFASFSLLNSGATDFSTGEVVTGRGCAVSLPLQACVLIASVVVAVVLVRREVPARRLD